VVGVVRITAAPGFAEGIARLNSNGPALMLAQASINLRWTL